MQFTVDDSRGNVGQTRVIEVLLTILPVAVAKGAKAEPPAEKYNHLEELVEAVIPYPCAFARFAIGGEEDCHRYMYVPFRTPYELTY